eukprot:COSAG02_NODE_9383_length_2235_cov_1.597378_3_plen_89_part_00
MLLLEQCPIALDVARWAKHITQPAAGRYLTFDVLTLPESISVIGLAQLTAWAQGMTGWVQAILCQVPVHLAHSLWGAAAAGHELIREA